MGKEKRAARAAGGANYGGTPYERPSGRGGRGSEAAGQATGMAGQGEIQASSNSLQALAGRESDDRAPQLSMWRSFVATPIKALKSTYNLLSGSPNQEAGTEQQQGTTVPQEASSTAAVLANGPQDNDERTADGDSIHLDHDMRSPSPPQGASPAASGAPAEGDRASSIDEIRAQSASLMVKTPISSSPFLKRQRPGSAQPAGLQFSGLSTPPAGRLSLGPGNLSRFAQLESTPAAPPLALTPIARPPRSVPRVSRPFSRTPVKLPLAADSSNEVPSSNAPQQVPAPPAWTPMRAQAMTPQTGGLRGFGLKRMREGEGTPGTPGTPLLQAGQASEAVRRIRQRSDKAVGSAERRVWRAGATPFPRRLGSAEQSPGNTAPAPSRLGASSRGPVPMTESARRIAEALDSMAKEAPMMATPPPAKPGPPPTDSLGAFPAAEDFSQKPSASQHKPLLLGPPTAGTPQGHSAASAAGPSQKPPQATLGGMWGSTGPDSQQPANNAGAPGTGGWGSHTQPAVSASGRPSASTSAPFWGQSSTALPSFGKANELSGHQHGAETPIFKFRPSRPLTDSAEKLRQERQQQQEAGTEAGAAPHARQPEPEPAPATAAALNAKAEAAAAQPLPDSDESDDEDAPGGVKGIMRKESPKENGAIANEKPKEDSKSKAPAAGGWGTDFLKQNAAAQASQSAAIAKEIAEQQGGAAQAPGKEAESKDAPSTSQSASFGSWGADFLKKNKESGAKANEAVAAAIEEQKGPTTAAPASTPWTFGNQASQPQATTQGASSVSGLAGFLSSITPESAASGFAPSTSSGAGLNARAVADSAAATTTFNFPAFKLPSGTPTFGLQAPAQDGSDVKSQDGPAKKRGRGGDDADADGAPASKGFNLGLPAPAFSAAAADGASAGSGFTMPSGTNAFGQSQLFSFGPAAALTGLSNKDAKEPQSGQDEAPAETIPASAGFAAVPSFLGAGGKPVEAASGGQLNPAAKPFTLNFGVGGLPKFGAEEPQPDDAKQDADAPAINGAAAGLPLSEDISGRSIDSNMSISPVAGSASATINPFTAADEVAPQPASGPPFASLFPPAVSAASAAAPAASSAPAQDANAKPAAYGIAGPSVGGSMHSFGMPGAAPGLLGATATTPAFGQGTDTVLGTSGFGLGTGQSPAAPFAFGASGGAPFGAQSSGGLFGANAASTSAQSTVSAGSAAGFTFGAQSSAVPGGTGGAAPAFSAQALNTGTGEATQQPAGHFAFGAAAHSNPQSTAAPLFTAPFGGASLPAFGASAPAPALGASSASAPGFGSASGAAPGFGGMQGAFGAQSTPAFGAASAAGFGGASGAAPGPNFGFGGAFGAGQKQDGQAQPPFGSMPTQPAFGQPSAVPAFGAQPAGQAAQPFGQPAVPAFSMAAAQQQQAQLGTGNGGFGALGGLAGNNAGSMTLGLGEQKQGGGNVARRKFKAKRPHK